MRQKEKTKTMPLRLRHRFLIAFVFLVVDACTQVNHADKEYVTPIQGEKTPPVPEIIQQIQTNYFYDFVNTKKIRIASIAQTESEEKLKIVNFVFYYPYDANSFKVFYQTLRNSNLFVLDGAGSVFEQTPSWNISRNIAENNVTKMFLFKPKFLDASPTLSTYNSANGILFVKTNTTNTTVYFKNLNNSYTTNTQLTGNTLCGDWLGSWLSLTGINAFFIAKKNSNYTDGSFLVNDNNTTYAAQDILLLKQNHDSTQVVYAFQLRNNALHVFKTYNLYTSASPIANISLTSDIAIKISGASYHPNKGKVTVLLYGNEGISFVSISNNTTSNYIYSISHLSESLAISNMQSEYKILCASMWHINDSRPFFLLGVYFVPKIMQNGKKGVFALFKVYKENMSLILDSKYEVKILGDENINFDINTLFIPQPQKTMPLVVLPIDNASVTIVPLEEKKEIKEVGI